MSTFFSIFFEIFFLAVFYGQNKHQFGIILLYRQATSDSFCRL